MHNDSQSPYLRCEGGNRLFLKLLEIHETSDCQHPPQETKELFLHDLVISFNKSLIFYSRTPATALQLCDDEVKQLVETALREQWAMWVEEPDKNALKLTQTGSNALHGGTPPSPSVESGDDAERVLLGLLDRTQRECDGVLQNDPRLLEAGVQLCHFRKWALHLGLSAVAFRNAFDTIIPEGFAVETGARVIERLVRITGKGMTRYDEITSRQETPTDSVSPVPEGGLAQTTVSCDGAQPLDQLEDPITTLWVIQKVGCKAGRADKLAEKMKRRGMPIVMVGGKNYCQRKDAMVMFFEDKRKLQDVS